MKDNLGDYSNADKFDLEKCLQLAVCFGVYLMNFEHLSF
jgi:hypothetical protein